VEPYIPEEGTIRADKWGELSVLRWLPVDGLAITEAAFPVEGREDYQQYVEWAKAGKPPPPISVSRHADGHLVSHDRRRLLAAREAGMDRIPSWVTISDDTGRPVEYGDLRMFDESKVKRDSGRFATKEGATTEDIAAEPEHIGHQIGRALRKVHDEHPSVQRAVRAAVIIGNTWPMVTEAVVRETGVSPKVARAAMVIATVGDFAIPGVPVASASITALASVATGGRAPYRAAKRGLDAWGAWRERKREARAVAARYAPDVVVRFADTGPDVDLISQIAAWVGDDENRLALLATIMDEGGMNADTALGWAQRFEGDNAGWAEDADADDPDTNLRLRDERGRFIARKAAGNAEE
jgi:hypothetical protein